MAIVAVVINEWTVYGTALVTLGSKVRLETRSSYTSELETKTMEVTGALSFV